MGVGAAGDTEQMTYIPEALRRQVTERAGECCEYCLLPQEFSLYSHEVDHIIAEKTSAVEP